MRVRSVLLAAILAGAPAASASAQTPPANSGCGDDGPTKSDSRPTARLTSATLRLRDSGRVRIFLHANQSAAMTVRISQAGGRRLGDTEPGGYTCARPGAGLVAVPLNAYGRKLVRCNGRLAVKLTLRLVNGSGVTNNPVLNGVVRPE